MIAVRDGRFIDVSSGGDPSGDHIESLKSSDDAKKIANAVRFLGSLDEPSLTSESMLDLLKKNNSAAAQDLVKRVTAPGFIPEEDDEVGSKLFPTRFSKINVKDYMSNIYGGDTAKLLNLPGNRALDNENRVIEYGIVPFNSSQFQRYRNASGLSFGGRAYSRVRVDDAGMNIISDTMHPGIPNDSEREDDQHTVDHEVAHEMTIPSDVRRAVVRQPGLNDVNPEAKAEYDEIKELFNRIPVSVRRSIGYAGTNADEFLAEALAILRHDVRKTGGPHPMLAPNFDERVDSIENAGSPWWNIFGIAPNSNFNLIKKHPATRKLLNYIYQRFSANTPQEDTSSPWVSDAARLFT